MGALFPSRWACMTQGGRGLSPVWNLPLDATPNRARNNEISRCLVVSGPMGYRTGSIRLVFRCGVLPSVPSVDYLDIFACLTSFEMSDLYNLYAHFGEVLSFLSMPLPVDVLTIIPVNFLDSNSVNSWDYTLNLARTCSSTPYHTVLVQLGPVMARRSILRRLRPPATMHTASLVCDFVLTPCFQRRISCSPTTTGRRGSQVSLEQTEMTSGQGG